MGAETEQLGSCYFCPQWGLGVQIFCPRWSHLPNGANTGISRWSTAQPLKHFPHKREACSETPSQTPQQASGCGDLSVIPVLRSEAGESHMLAGLPGALRVQGTLNKWNIIEENIQCQPLVSTHIHSYMSVRPYTHSPTYEHAHTCMNTMHT